MKKIEQGVMTFTTIQKKLAEGIVRLVEEIIDYKTEVAIGGFVKITADHCNVFPIKLREYRTKEKSLIKEEKGVSVEKARFTRGRKRKLDRGQWDNNGCNAQKQIKKEVPNSEDRLVYTCADKDYVHTIENKTNPLKKKLKSREKHSKAISNTKDVKSGKTKEDSPCFARKPSRHEHVSHPVPKLLVDSRVLDRDRAFHCQIGTHQVPKRTYICKVCKKHLKWTFEVKKHSQGSFFKYTCRKCKWPGKRFCTYEKFAGHIRIYHKAPRYNESHESIVDWTLFEETHSVKKTGRKYRKLSDVTKGKTVLHCKTREVPKPQVGLLEENSDVVFVRTVKSKTGKDTKVVHEPQKCPYCDMVYWHSASLKNHINGQHSEHQFTCTVCGISTKHESSLKRHMKTHDTVENFACDQCDKKYKRNCELLRHIKFKHSGLEKTFICSWCGDKFLNANYLKAHENRHRKTGQNVLQKGKKGQIHSCTECNKVFSKESLLKSHISVTHKNERNFGCGVCGKFYGRSCHLRRHQLVVHGIRVKDTVLIKEDRDVEDQKPTLPIEQEAFSSQTLELGSHFVPEETEFVIVSDPASQTLILQSSSDVLSGVDPKEEEVVVLQQCPMCGVACSGEEEIKVHFATAHNAIVEVVSDTEK